jgi:hypothetical protein
MPIPNHFQNWQPKAPTIFNFAMRNYMDLDASNFPAFKQNRDELLIDYGICINIIAIKWGIILNDYGISNHL